MGGIDKVILIFFFIAILPQVVPAQGPPWRKGEEERGGRGMMMGPMHAPMMDWASQLDLTLEQAAKIQELRETFLRDTLVWRNELVIKRFDIRDLLRNPQSEPNEILAKQKEIFDLQARIQERGLLLHIEMRKVLTPEQIKLLPPHWGGMPGPPMTPGRGRGMGREY